MYIYEINKYFSFIRCFSSLRLTRMCVQRSRVSQGWHVGGEVSVHVHVRGREDRTLCVSGYVSTSKDTLERLYHKRSK